MSDRRKSAAETRATILDATAALLEEQGTRGLTVGAVMKRAGVSRTAFYRQFHNISEVLAASLEALLEELYSEAADWFTDMEAVGSRDVDWANALRDRLY